MKTIVEILINLCDKEVINENSSHDPIYRGYYFYTWCNYKDKYIIEFSKKDDPSRNYVTTIEVTEGESKLLAEAMNNRAQRHYEFFSNLAKQELGFTK